MYEATTIRIDRLDADIATTASGRFKIGPMQTAYEGHVDPKVGDVLIVAKTTPKDESSVLVSVYKGCGCHFLIYPQER